MRNDDKGNSTCEAGRETYERYYSSIGHRDMIQYDFRTDDGELFSCVCTTLKECRVMRDSWLAKRQTA